MADWGTAATKLVTTGDETPRTQPQATAYIFGTWFQIDYATQATSGTGNLDTSNPFVPHVLQRLATVTPSGRTSFPHTP